MLANLVRELDDHDLSVLHTRNTQNGLVGVACVNPLHKKISQTGVQRSLTERLVMSRLQWAGHVERMADDRLPKRAAELCEQGRRRRGRPRLRWEDCVKRDVRQAGEEEDWKKKTRDRGGWKRLSDEAVKKLRAAPHP